MITKWAAMAALLSFIYTMRRNKRNRYKVQSQMFNLVPNTKTYKKADFFCCSIKIIIYLLLFFILSTVLLGSQ